MYFVQIKRFLADLPVVETISFLILVLITVYRKRLSSNHGYRYREQSPDSSKKDQVKRRRYSATNNNAGNPETENFQLTSIIHDFKVEVLSSLVTDPSDIFHEDRSSKSNDNSDDASSPLGSGMTASFKVALSSVKSALVGADTATYPSAAASIQLPTTTSQSLNQSMNILSLSNELILHILVNCETIDIIKLSLVSRRFRAEIVHNEFIWEQLWKITYAHVWQDPAIVEIRMLREIHWDPLLQYPSPQYGWFKFYLAFELCWIDWLLAGLCTREKCFIAINDAVFHLTDFIPEHPGSAETLLDHSGGDATDVFVDIGHSDYALSLMESYCIFDPHEIYLSKAHQRVRALRETYYNQMKIRHIPAITPLHDAIRQLQKRVLKLHESHSLSSAMGLSSKSPSALSHEESFPLAPKLKSYLPCTNEGSHFGQCRSYFDPLSRDWVLWYTCCGKGRVLAQVPPEIMEESVLRDIFEDDE